MLPAILVMSMLGSMGPAQRIMASESTIPERAQQAAFNSGFLNGQSRGIDLSRFAYGNPTLAGTYYADVYVNGAWKGRNELHFEMAPGDTDAHTCFTLEMLERYSVDTRTLDGADALDPHECRSLEGWLPGAFTRFDTSSLRFDISVPQAYMRRSARGYVDPRFWDPGVTAGLLGYNFNLFSTQKLGEGGNTSRETAYLNLNSGFNMAGWQLRHDSNLAWNSGRDGSHWQNTATYARRPLPQVGNGSLLTLGDAYTEGNLFDSIGYRGVQLASDDRMLPDALRGYAPEVRGVAESNALVEVRQNGQLIYQATVAPGPFVIDDLYPTGYGGDLELTVTEADGRQRRFFLPYASVPQMLRPGASRYSLTAGRTREEAVDDSAWLLRGTYQSGLSNAVTGYAGTTVSEGYAALIAGGALGTRLGAFSFDVTHAETDFERHADQRGQSYKLGYSKFIPESGTNFTVAAYRYSTEGYLSLRDALLAHDYEDRGLDVAALRRQRSELQLTLNQGLGPRYGSLYATGALRDYWNAGGSTKHYQVGYNNRFGRVNYGISAQRTSDEFGHDDTQYYLTASLPIASGAGSTSLHASVGVRNRDYESGRVGISGAAGVDGNFTYNASLSDYRNGATTGEISGQYRGLYAAVRGSHSYSEEYRQTGLGATGSVVMHEGGVTLTPQRGETMVIVEAPDAAGARVTNASGVRVDGRGYAVVPYATPYRLNAVSLDPNDMSSHVELKSNSQQVAPYAGAVAKLTFETVSGRALLIEVRRTDGSGLPFGAEVLDEQGQPVGLVGQGSRVYLRSERDSGRLTAKWGERVDEQCVFAYRLPATAASDQPRYERLEANCES